MRLLGTLPVPELDDGDLEGDAPLKGLLDVGEGPGVGAAALGDAVVLLGVVGVVRRGQSDVRVHEQVPQTFGRLVKVREHLDAEALVKGVPQQLLEVRVACGLAADELDGGDPGGRSLGEQLFPLAGRHRAV